MSDLDEKRLAVVIKALRDMGNDIFGHKEDAAAILAALAAFDAADAREAVTDDVARHVLEKFYGFSETAVCPQQWIDDMRAALEHAAPLLARRARAPMPAVVTGRMKAAALKAFYGQPGNPHELIGAMLEAALAAAPQPQPVERHMTLGEQRTAMNALRRAGRPVEHVGIGMTDKSEPAPTPPAALREVASTARTLARLSPANPALAKFAEAVARWAEGQP